MNNTELPSIEPIKMSDIIDIERYRECKEENIDKCKFTRSSIYLDENYNVREVDRIKFLEKCKEILESKHCKSYLTPPSLVILEGNKSLIKRGMLVFYFETDLTKSEIEKEFFNYVLEEGEIPSK